MSLAELADSRYSMSRAQLLTQRIRLEVLEDSPSISIAIILLDAELNYRKYIDSLR